MAWRWEESMARIFGYRKMLKNLVKKFSSKNVKFGAAV